MGMVLTSKELGELLPQRRIFRLLDRVEMIDDTHYVAIKNVTINDEFFCGHFPKHPIMPGVLQLEALRQLAAVAVAKRFSPNADLYLKLVEKVKFRRPVTPGDRMKLEVEILDFNCQEVRVRATCSSAAGSCSEAILTLAERKICCHVEMPDFPSKYDRNGNTAMEIDKVMELMPHRYPFLFIDNVVSIDGEHLVAIKNISCSEKFFSCGYDVIPEAILCEIAAQSGCACVLSRPENAGKLGYFMAIDRAETFRSVYPGDQLVIEIDLPPGKSKFGKGSGSMYVDGEKVFSITLMFAIVDA